MGKEVSLSPDETPCGNHVVQVTLLPIDIRTIHLCRAFNLINRGRHLDHSEVDIGVFLRAFSPGRHLLMPRKSFLLLWLGVHLSCEVRRDMRKKFRRLRALEVEVLCIDDRWNDSREPLKLSSNRRLL